LAFRPRAKPAWRQDACVDAEILDLSFEGRGRSVIADEGSCVAAEGERLGGFSRDEEPSRLRDLLAIDPEDEPPAGAEGAGEVDLLPELARARRPHDAKRALAPHGERGHAIVEVERVTERFAALGEDDAGRALRCHSRARDDRRCRRIEIASLLVVGLLEPQDFHEIDRARTAPERGLAELGEIDLRL